MATFETWIGMSLSMMPPCIVWPCALVWRLAMLMPSMITRSWSGITRVMGPSLPTSLPAMTRTWSPFFTFMSQHLRSERHDSHEPSLAQLAAHRPEDAGTPRLHLVVDEDGCVLVEPDVTPVRTPPLLLRADDDALHDVALLHRRARHRVLDGRHEDVADRRVATARPAEHLDAQHLAGAGVVGHLEARLLLDHRARSRISTTRQRFCADIGRVSLMRTRSPSRTSFASSCA